MVDTAERGVAARSGWCQRAPVRPRDVCNDDASHQCVGPGRPPRRSAGVWPAAD